MRTIFAMGGGGFTMEPENPALDDYILSLAGKPAPKVLFLPTASGDPNEHIHKFMGAFGSKVCEPEHLSLFRLGSNPVDLEALLFAQDIIYVGGGSMRNLLAIWRVHELDRILRECWERGIVLAGLSAGAMCWMQWGVTKSGGRPERCQGLGYLTGSLSVHYDGEPDRRPVFLQGVADGELPDGWGADDGVGLLFRDQEFIEAVSSRPAGRAFRVEWRDGEAVETPLEVRYLGGASNATPRVSDDIAEFRAMRYGAMGR
ncbi:MAG: peptidase E [Solirubrobacteraceae bacterium]|nr:peptidase E [Solirubrobacteraceae bacterium]